MTTTNPFTAIKKQKGRGLQSPPKPEDLKVTAHKKENSPAVEVNPPRRSYKISTLIHESAGSDLEMIMIKIRQQTGRKPKQAEALEKAIEALKERYEVL